MTDDEDRLAYNREKTRRYRERQKALGVSRKPSTEEQKARERKRMASRRALARATGEVLATDTWHERNPDKHRARVQKWRTENLEAAREIARENQATRRSTPWGRINNNLGAIINRYLPRGGTVRHSRYVEALGYTLADLKAHLEAQFAPEWTWANWGDLWEIDHIRPVSSFHYTSLDDPLFREAWSLSNLRPLCRYANASKGKRIT